MLRAIIKISLVPFLKHSSRGSRLAERNRTCTQTCTAQLVCTQACTIVRAYLWISIQWWCLLKIPRRFPPLTPPPRFFTVLEKHDALSSRKLCVSSRNDLCNPEGSSRVIYAILLTGTTVSHAKEKNCTERNISRRSRDYLDILK